MRIRLDMAVDARIPEGSGGKGNYRLRNVLSRIYWFLWLVWGDLSTSLYCD